MLLISPTLPAQDMMRARRCIDSLCSPTMHGRGYVQKGDRKAADFIYKEFQQVGLLPFKENYYQFFKLSVNTFPKRAELKVGKTRLTVGKDFIINPVSGGGVGKGKIWLFDTLLLKDKARQATFLQLDMRNYVAVLTEQQFHDLLALPKKVIDKIYDARALIQLMPRKLVASVAQENLGSPYFEVNQTKFDSIIAPYLHKKQVHKAKIRYKLDNLQDKNYTSQNVIGYIEGTSEVDSFVVFTAHYDHLGRQGKDCYFAGANDNAAGVAMLIELAHHFKRNRPKYSVVFMAFAGEEIGLLGSKHYTEYPLFPLERIKFLINLDLVGTGDDGATVVNGTIYKKQFEKLLKLNEEKQYLPKINARSQAANSDHYFFWLNKVPCFFLYGLGGISAYHDIYDKPETLPLTRFRGIFSLVRDFAEGF
jgi:hypothetical protein